ncbi:MAG: T9SS type A sorting domain-containing protein, partial [Bacteroidota bacterium]
LRALEVRLYILSNVSTPYLSGWSSTTGDIQGNNFQNNVNDNNNPGFNSFGQPILTGPGGAWYYLRIENKFIQIFIPEVAQGPSGDFYIQYQNGSFSVTFNQRGIVQVGGTYDWSTTFNVTLKNSFGGGGKVKFAGVEYLNVPSTGFIFKRPAGSYTIEAIDGQSSGGFVQRFDVWTGPNLPNPASLANTVSISANATYTANFNREFNIVFQNSLPGAGSGGVIKVNNTQYNSPTSSFAVVEPGTITGEALYQVINGIEYTFSSWSPGGSTSASTVFTPGNHTTYTANFTAKPTVVPNFTVGGATGQNVQLNWSQHVNSNVTYQIWRRAKDRGNVDELLITLPHSTTTWTDNAYVIGSGIGSTSLSYDARGYFTPSGTTATPRWVFVSGIPDGPDPKKIPSPLVQRLTDIPAENAISAYPNPFNPSTTISYQLVEDALVTLTVYDMMGREIVVLVKAEKSASYHSVQWNGRDAYDNPAATGVYMYRFTATPKSGKETILKSGKLLLAK